MKILSVCALIVLTTLKGFSQDSTTCLPNKQLRIAIEQIKRGQQAEREVRILRRNDTIWASIVRERDSVISLLRSKERNYAAVEDGYVTRLKLAEQQHQVTKDWAAELGGKLRKQRRKTLLWAIGGVVATGASVYFLK